MFDNSSGILTFDLGGAHIAAAVMGDSRWQASTVSSPLPAGFGQVALLDAIRQTGHDALSRLGNSANDLGGIALAAPGPFDYTRGISRMEHKHRGLYGVDLRGHLANSFGVKPKDVAFLNDAQSFLLGETAQAGLLSYRVAGFTLGTGIGSAFYEEGQVLEDDPRIPPGGEVWNLPWNGGTVEDILSTRAIGDAFQDATGTSLSVKEIAVLAASDDTASRIFKQFGRNLGLVADALCARFQPDHIVLGGGIARSAALFLPEMQRAFTRIKPKLHVTTLFEEAALYGAAEFWRTQQARN